MYSLRASAYSPAPTPICRTFDRHTHARPASRALPREGRRRLIRSAMTAITTRTSISVNAAREFARRMLHSTTAGVHGVECHAPAIPSQSPQGFSHKPGGRAMFQARALVLLQLEVLL